MNVVTDNIRVSTKGNSDIIDITGKVEDVLKKHKLTDGILTVFVVGSTASVTTTEYEPGLRKDIPEMLERIAPSNKPYHHDNTWGDGNGYAHVRASFLGPSLVIPFSNSKLLLGTWQQIILIDFDNRPRNREIVVQLIGK